MLIIQTLPEERQELLFQMHADTKLCKQYISFSTNVQQCNIAFSIVIVHVQLCFKISFIYHYISFLPVGLCEWKITNVHPVLAIMFKNF